MKKITLTLIGLTTVIIGWSQTGKELVFAAAEATGGKSAFYNLKNVNYDFEYRTPPGEKATTLIGHETYVFDGEKSYAAYTTHSLTGANGKVVEGYDGTNAWVAFDGILSTDKKANGVSRFLRKTNYYWFAMFFKLTDDGVNYENLSDQSVHGKEYNRVKITFKEKVGDASDTYILYINKETKLIDQFLFTVAAFGLTKPSLMTYEWETIHGIKIPSKRKYIQADWEGTIIGKDHTITNWTNIMFNTVIDSSIFKAPSK